MPAFPKPIHLAHQYIKQILKPGDIAVDATLGNGHDALFLARLVGDKGIVIGFDIQPAAIDSSTLRMEENNISHYMFHLTGHQKMAEYIDEMNMLPRVVMFNLGYLPNADKSIITTEQTTIPALNAARQLLSLNGLISIMCYPGHEGGDVESIAVSQWARCLSREDYRVVKYEMHNAPNNPPFLILVEKLKID